MSETCIIVTDGSKCFKEASENVYPKAMHITCTVHMIRNSEKYVLHSMKPDFFKRLKKHIWSRQLRKCKTQLWIFKK
ncbi:transposase [Mycoplasmoides gallisepticum]